MYGLIYVLFFKVGHIYVSFGMLGVSIRPGGRHLRFGEVLRCLGHDGWLTAIELRHVQIPFQFLQFLVKHCPRLSVRYQRRRLLG